jgi:exonuclease III
LNLLSLNVRGLGNCDKKSSLFHWLKKYHDARNKIVFLQETHVTSNKEPKWKEVWDGEMEFANGTSNSRGVAILLPKCLDYEIIEIKRDPGGRYIAMKIIIEGLTYGLINGYAPTSNMLEAQLKWLESITAIIEEFIDIKIIFGGDINDGLTILDKFIGREKWKESAYVLGWKETCREFQLVDIWRILFPLAHKYTWKQGTTKKNLRRSRLDFWLISTGLMYSIDTVSIEPGYGSDHSLITLSLYKQEESKQGPSFWKFNTSLLRDNIYINKTATSIRDLKQKYNYVNDKGLRWDLIKMDLRSEAISYSKFLAKSKRDNLKEMLDQQVKLEIEIAKDPTDDLLNTANTLKENIEKANAEKARGAMLRSKANWVEYGEKNTSFFLKLENRNRDIKNITQLIDDSDKVIQGQQEILDEELRYYKTLYTQPVQNNSELRKRDQSKALFLGDDIPKISQEERDICDGDITIEEIGKALKELKNGKTPGTDGFPPDFYKFFWTDLKVLVFESLAFVVEKKEMSIDQRRGIINLIPKGDKDIRKLKNWRPISLLNTDYKILTKTLATRLKKVLPTVIHPDQVAYLKERYIGQNIRTIIDVMEYTKENNLEGLIAFLDFEKAFDTIDWRALDEALECFNIGQNFRSWVKGVYKNTVSCVTNCGFSSVNFEVSRGVRQGCPLSAYLFIAVAEILAIRIRKDNEIKGIKVDNQELKVVQMADDTTSFLRDCDSLQKLLDMIEIFKIFAGLKLNMSKSEVMWIGSNRGSKKAPLGLKLVEGTKALGIFYSYDEKEVEEKNFVEKLKELRGILGIWGQRDLSILGRITLFKSLAFSKVIYQCSNLAVSSDVIKELNQIAFKFIWYGKPEKVKRTTVIADYSEGGVKMIDVECFISAQKVMWMKRLIKNGEGSWRIYPHMLLNTRVGIHSFECNTDMAELKRKMPTFYYQLFEAWNKTTEVPGNDPFKLRREIIWFNKNIKIKKREFCYNHWYKKGIIMLHDLLEENGELKSPERLEAQFNLPIKTMAYNSLISAIPQAWKKAVKKMRIPQNAISNTEQPFLNCNNRLVALSVATNRDVYWVLVRKKQTIPICAAKWATKYNVEMANDGWKAIYKTYSGLKDTRMKAFQFKVLNNLIPCNLYLKRIGKSDTDKCPICNELDDITHFLAACPETALAWKQLERWWNAMTNQNKVIDEKSIMIGAEMYGPMHEQWNLIIMATKWRIYANKIMGQSTCLYQILCAIRNMLNINKLIANKIGRVENYTKMWGDIESYLT